MRKLVESKVVSLDGVIASPERWSLFDEESSRWTLQELDNYETFLMGRVTYATSGIPGDPPPGDLSASGSMRCPNTSPPGH